MSELHSNVLEAGDAVRVDGLVSASHHNGSMGLVIRLDVTKGRYAVRLQEVISGQEGALLSVKKENVRPVSELCPPRVSAKDDAAEMIKAATNSNHGDLIRIFLRGSNINCVDKYGETPLHAAVALGNLATIKLLLKLGGKATLPAKDGSEAIHLAAGGGHSEVVQLLAEEYDCSVLAKDHDGLQPIHHAAVGGYEETIRLLVQLGADASARDLDGLTPLHACSLKGHDSTARMLVSEFGANPSAADNDGATSLHVACMEGHKVLAWVLCHELGADPHAADNSGLTPADIAKEEGHAGALSVFDDESRADCG